MRDIICNKDYKLWYVDYSNSATIHICYQFAFDGTMKYLGVDNDGNYAIAPEGDQRFTKTWELTNDSSLRLGRCDYTWHIDSISDSILVIHARTTRFVLTPVIMETRPNTEDNLLKRWSEADVMFGPKRDKKMKKQSKCKSY